MTDIRNLELSVRTVNCLLRENIKNIEELGNITAKEMMQIRNFGRKSLNELREILEGLNLSFKPSFHTGNHIPYYWERPPASYFTEWKPLLEYLLSTLPLRDAFIMYHIYIHEPNKSVRELFEFLNLSRERIRQIVQTSQRRLRHPSRRKYMESLLQRLPVAKKEQWSFIKAKIPKLVHEVFGGENGIARYDFIELQKEYKKEEKVTLGRKKSAK